MAQWKKYQEETASLFRELGCTVQTDVELQGARSRHRVDVSVRFFRFGLKQHWIIECKLWKRSVPKEKVMALKSIVEDVGADRGILIAEAGHQSGAHMAAQMTNMTLISLPELRDAAKAELLSLGLSEVRRRAATIKHYVFSLFETKREPGGFSISRMKAGVDGQAATRAASAASVMDMGAEQAQLGNFPVPLSFTEDGTKIIRANDLEEFVVSASDILDQLETIIAGIRAQGS